MDTTPRNITLFDIDDQPCGEVTLLPLLAYPGSVVVWMGRKFKIGGPGEYYSQSQAGEIEPKVPLPYPD